MNIKEKISEKTLQNNIDLYNICMKYLKLVFIIFLVSCASNNRQIIDYYYNNIEGIDYVILPYDPGRDEGMFLAFREGIPTELSYNELDLINSLLCETVIKYNNEEKAIWGSVFVPIELSKYNRQYIAIINKNGEKEVYVNCFRAGVIGYWRENFIFVLDGGKNFFQVKINLTNLEIIFFNVNGYA